MKIYLVYAIEENMHADRCFKTLVGAFTTKELAEEAIKISGGEGLWNNDDLDFIYGKFEIVEQILDEPLKLNGTLYDFYMG